MFGIKNEIASFLEFLARCRASLFAYMCTR